MSKKYNVLWIDDEHESMKALHKTAVDFDIKLFPYKSMNGGCSEFENNTSKYDAVLFDAKFFENETDQPGSEDTKWVHQAKDRIRDQDRSIAFIVLTGQAETYNSREFKNAFPYVFNKGVEEDEDNLFNLLVEACENREITQLKHSYFEAFESFNLGIVSSKYESLLIDITQAYVNNDFRKVNINVQRDLLEGIYVSLNKEIPCIPDALFNDKGLPIQEHCTKYMEDRNIDGHKLNKEVPQVIKSAFRKLKESTNEYSHLSDETIVKIPFLANTFLFMEILEWLPEFAQTHYNNYI
ncbi:hypothetical protein [Leeuwenhoekiella blandensis]|uniref:Uncharacterized protein n=1 Tax=Leeuwenhoekiella blandensis (strain CECT 7118 / CCUG 51940 / KCTC 22103 / MED217) TaxID=398720 RepID=A3XIU4_LEEBM|nr:hypothetical protein [Leeuwenhoekiella blandensis]EAQ50528.1 hypothetical protein MED217_05832 [Leeuwenhoekiella blandensis MED217]